MTRPKKDNMLTHTRRITFRLTDAEADMLFDTAKEAGLSCSEYIRKQLLEKQVNIKYEIVADITDLNKLTAEVGKIGNNLNQIAKYFHTGGIRSKAMQDEISECIAKLYSLRSEILRLAGDFHGSVETYRK